MRIWIDIRTPKQVLFFHSLVRRLGQEHTVLCTSRWYRELVGLAKLRGFDELEMFANYGGASLRGKLDAAITRMAMLTERVASFGPDLAISHGSPDATRVAFGLGIPQIGFSDAPHATVVGRLCVPLLDRLLTPWVIPKPAFSCRGIPEEHIIHYRAIDAAVIVRAGADAVPRSAFGLSGRPTVLFRTVEDKAAYVTGPSQSDAILTRLLDAFSNCNILVLPRYEDQIESLRSAFPRDLVVLGDVIDAQQLLPHVDVFVGSGGTMTAEAALMGVPTVSYDGVPNYYEQYIVRENLARRAREPEAIECAVRDLLSADRPTLLRRARQSLDAMEDPFDVLLKVMDDLCEPSVGG